LTYSKNAYFLDPNANDLSKNSPAKMGMESLQKRSLGKAIAARFYFENRIKRQSPKLNKPPNFKIVEGRMKSPSKNLLGGVYAD
jgi:hypothetical protein